MTGAILVALHSLCLAGIIFTYLAHHELEGFIVIITVVIVIVIAIIYYCCHYCCYYHYCYYYYYYYITDRGEPAASSFNGKWPTCSVSSRTQSSAQRSGLAELELLRLEYLLRALLPGSPCLGGPAQSALP